MWLCPNCNRSFKSTNQFHSCKVIDIDSHFKNKSTELKNTFDCLKHFVMDLGKNISINSVTFAIFFRTSTSFLEVKIKKDHLLIAFSLNRIHDEFPVSLTMPYSKKLTVHLIHLAQPEDISPQVIALLKEAYALHCLKK